MTRFKPEKLEKRKRLLRTCTHGDCVDHEIWDLGVCWNHLTEDEKKEVRKKLADALRAKQSLSKIVLSRADLSGFDFQGADLSESFLDHCNLVGAKFVETDLRHAYLGWADLCESDLSRAHIHGAVFTHARMHNVLLLAFSLSSDRHPVNLDANNFRGTKFYQRPKVREDGPAFAAATYRRLKAYFSAEGDFASASWAAYCELAMARKQMWKDRQFLSWTASYSFGMVSGYGEKPLRVVLASAVAVLLFGALYSAFGLVVGQSAQGSFSDSIFFSAMTFASTTFPHLTPVNSTLAKVLVATESLLGIFALGLFLFTLTKRGVAR